jgi:hypothetical protein
MPRPSSGSGLTIAQLQQMLEGRRVELNKLRKKRNDIQRDLDALDRQIERVGGGMGGRRGGNGSRVRNEMSLNDTIDQVLRGGGKPMKVGEIVDGVLATGYKSNSANFRGIVNQTLIKDKRFTASERGTYQIKNRGGGGAKAE